VTTYLIDYTEKLPSGRRVVNGTVTPSSNNVSNFRAVLTTAFAPATKLFVRTSTRYLRGGKSEQNAGPFHRV
jgi:hypothetical protein